MTSLSLTSAFATKLDAGYHSFSMQYKSEGSFKDTCPGETPTHNLNMELITLHHELKFYKFI